MQVLLITQEFPPHVLGGVGYHAYHLAEALVDYGHDVHVLTGRSDQHTVDDSTRPLPSVEVSTISYRRSIAPRLWFARKAERWLESFEDLETFDLLHAHEYLNFDVIPFDGPTIQKVHFNLTEKPEYLPRPMVPRPFNGLAVAFADATLWRAERRLERRALQTADLAVANSQLTKRLCHDRHDVPSADVKVIYNGVDEDRFTPAEETDEATNLLFVGGDQQRKGVDELLDALRGLAPTTEVGLTVAGSTDGLDTQKLESTLPVEFVGRVGHGELVKLYRRSAGLVHPALYEPFGNVVLESLACGRPVVVSDSDHCGAAELIEDRVGITVDPQDPVALAEAMQTLAMTPERFDSERCRSLAEGYTWDRVATETLDLAQQCS